MSEPFLLNRTRPTSLRLFGLAAGLAVSFGITPAARASEGTEPPRGFVARAEFKIPAGGNNGLAIRYPGQGNTSSTGMRELQILDDTAQQYARLDPRQYHGSVYGMVAARRGSPRPVGDWNSSSP